MAKEFKLTRERLKELEAELNYLKTTREKEVAEQIKEARSFGDLSEITMTSCFIFLIFSISSIIFSLSCYICSLLSITICTFCSC